MNALGHELMKLVRRLEDPRLSNASVITWSSPILSFGNVVTSRIATLGINPSNREFVDQNGNELMGNQRRFHTLKSLGLNEWAEAEHRHLRLMLRHCEEYFLRNPYDGWFKKLDYIISGTAISYYFPSVQACHLDLIPYATSAKWTDLRPRDRSFLLELGGQTLGRLLRASSIELLILNGRTVVENFQLIADVRFRKALMPNWTLPRKSNGGVSGYSFAGTITHLGGVNLDRDIRVIGYNHNIQGSFGVTSEVQRSIRDWVARKAKSSAA